MVKGIELFADHFRDVAGQYVLIGGAACDLLLESTGTPFRATRDLDIILLADDTVSKAFVARLWEFIDRGKYAIGQRADGGKTFYRFLKPLGEGYPAQIELFARNVLELSVPATRLTPIPVEGDVPSLSAILMDEDYYRLVTRTRRTHTVMPVSIVPAEVLIALKAKAWLELRRMKAEGQSVKELDIKKHRSDIFRLLGMLSEDMRPSVPDSVRGDIGRFVIEIAAMGGDEEHAIARSIGQSGFRMLEQAGRLATIFSLSLGG